MSGTALTPRTPRARSSKLRRLWRWTWRGAFVLFALLVLARVTHPLWLPSVLDRVVADRGLELEYRDLDLSVLGGRVELTHLRLAPRGSSEGEAAPPLVLIHHADLDLNVLALLTGDIVVRRAVVDGLDVELELDSAGKWNFERYLAPTEGESPDQEAIAEAEPATDGPLDFRLPFVVEDAGLHGVRVHLVDALADPPLDTIAHLDASIVDLGHPERPMRFEVQGSAEELLDVLRIHGGATAGERALDANLVVELRGLHARQLAADLERLGIRPHAEGIDGTARVSIVLSPREGDAMGTAGELRVEDVALRADLSESVALDELVVEVGRMTKRSVELPRVHTRGVRGAAQRLEDGALRFAGLDLVGMPPSDDEHSREEPEDERGSGEPPVIALGHLSVPDVSLQFFDASVTPPADLRITAALDVRDLVLDPARPGAALELDARLALADAAECRLSGRIVPTGEERSLELAVRGEAITYRALEPYLAAAGLESTLQAASFSMDVAARARAAADGGFDANASISGLKLADGGIELAALGEVAIEGVHLAPDGGARIEQVHVAGLRLPAEMDEARSLYILGVRTVPARMSTHSPREPLPPARARAPALREGPLPRVELGQLVWDDTVIHFEARHLKQPVSLRVEEVALKLEGLAFGGDPAKYEATPATLELAARIEGIADSFDVCASLLLRPGDLDLEADLAIEGRGLRLDAVAGLLAELGIEPALDAGSFDARIAAVAKREGEFLRVNATVSEVKFADGGRELLALDSLVIGDVAAGPGEVSIARLEIRSPRIALARATDGALELAGIRILAARPSPEEPLPARPPPAPPEALASSAAPKISLGHFALEDAHVSWKDAAVEPAVDTELDLAAEMSAIATAIGSPPAHFDVHARVLGSLDALSITGEARLDPADLGVEATVDARGLRAGGLASYLPPGIRVDLKDGRFGARFAAGTRVHEIGGRDAHLELGDVALSESDASEPLFALGALRLDAPRIDPDAGVYEIERAVTEGLVAEVRRTAAGFALPGVTLLAAVPNAALEPDASPDSEVSDAEPVDSTALEVPRGDPQSTAGIDTPPTVRLGTLALGFDTLRFVDELGAGVPVEASFALTTDGPQDICQPDPRELPPLRFALLASARPIVDGMRADLTLSPYLQEPSFTLEASVDGVRGPALTEILPALAASIDASALQAGTFRARANGVLRMMRRGPADFDFARGFGADLAVSDVTWRAVPDGEVLAGVGHIDVDVRRVLPATGDVHIAVVEVADIVGRARRLPEGIEAGGVLLKTPPPKAEGAPAEPPPAEAAPATPPVESTAQSSEVRIDRILLTGLDFEFVDEVAQPVARLPLENMDVDVRGFTTKAFEERRAITFRARIDAGSIEFPERTGDDALLGGIASSLGNLVSNEEVHHDLQSRRVWDQLELKGRLLFAPELSGQVQVDLQGFELPVLAGAAASSGVTIGDGVLDSKLGLRFKGADGVAIDLRAKSSYLSLSEGEDGPISRYLGLSAPLDTVLFLLRDESGEHSISFRTDVGGEDLSAGGIVAAGGEAIAQLISDALAAAPVRLLGPLTSVVDVLGFTPEPLSAETVVLGYGPGVVLPDPDVLAGLHPLFEAMHSDPALRVVVQHELGGGDIAKSERLVNPDEEQCLAIVARLRDHEAALNRKWDERAALARAQYAVGQTDLAEASTAELRGYDRELVAAEAALDRMFELLRPGAERKREQRTRAAALALANERMVRLREAVLQAGGGDLAGRLEFRHPRFVPAEGAEGGKVTFTPRKKATDAN